MSRVTVLPPGDPLILLDADREAVADAIGNLVSFGGPRDARQFLATLDGLVDNLAGLCASVDAEERPERRWQRRAELFLAGAVTSEALERWRREAEEMADRDTAPMAEAHPEAAGGR